MTKELDVKRVRYDQIKLYRRVQGGNFSCTFRIPGEKTPFRRSLKTKDIVEAEIKANELFNKISFRIEQNEPAFDKTFREVAELFLKKCEQLSLTDDLSASAYYEHRRILNSMWIPYLGHRNIRQIQNHDLHRFDNWRKDYVISAQKQGRLPRSRETLSDTGLRAHLNSFSATMTYAKENGWIRDEQIPRRKVKKPTVSRPAFTKNDYKKLYRKLGSWEKQPVRERKELLVRKQFHYWFLIMSNTGMRLGEARELRWKDIEFFDDDGAECVAISIPYKTKTGRRECIGAGDSPLYFHKLRQVYIDDWGFKPSPEDYVFCTLSRGPRKKWWDIFNNFKEFTGVTHFDAKQPYTIYSLRHFYATERLRNKVSVYSLAENMGTSVHMIHKHYGHLVMRDVAQELTQIKRRKRAID